MTIRALFYTTQTIDCANHVRAWESAFGPAAQVTYDHRKPRHEKRWTWALNEHRPDVVFYIGAHIAPGNPTPQEFVEGRRTAKVINICSDAGDKPWHQVLYDYRKWGCFDLQVGIDGAMDAPVDLVTLTPVDSRPFHAGEIERTIRCGFSGTVGRWNPRSEIVLSLKWFGGLTVRDRAKADGYIDHVRFLRRCRMVLNVSRTGTGAANHVKGRVLEVGWAGACLLESEGSPIGQWFPEDCYILYRDPPHAAELIRSLSDEEINRTARRLAEEVNARFTPERIYGDILERVGIVRPTVAA